MINSSGFPYTFKLFIAIDHSHMYLSAITGTSLVPSGRLFRLEEARKFNRSESREGNAHSVPLPNGV